MGDRVWYATSGLTAPSGRIIEGFDDNGTAKTLKYKTSREENVLNTGFSGFPFAVFTDADAEDDNLTAWKAACLGEGKSRPMGLTFQELFDLYWRVQGFEISQTVTGSFACDVPPPESSFDLETTITTLSEKSRVVTGDGAWASIVNSAGSSTSSDMSSRLGERVYELQNEEAEWTLFSSNGPEPGTHSGETGVYFFGADVDISIHFNFTYFDGELYWPIIRIGCHAEAEYGEIWTSYGSYVNEPPYPAYSADYDQFFGSSYTKYSGKTSIQANAESRSWYSSHTITPSSPITLTFCGHSIAIPMWEYEAENASPSPGIDFGEMTITAKYWPYANSQGQPVWNTSTGAQLVDPAS